jgi:hypothetical protein
MITILLALVLIGAPFIPSTVGHACLGVGRCIECFDQHGNMIAGPMLTQNSTLSKGCVPVILF